MKHCYALITHKGSTEWLVLKDADQKAITAEPKNVGLLEGIVQRLQSNGLIGSYKIVKEI